MINEKTKIDVYKNVTKQQLYEHGIRYQSAYYCNKQFINKKGKIMKQSKSEIVYSQLSKGINFDKQFQKQSNTIQTEFMLLAIQYGYISGAEAFRTMRTYHRKIKEMK